MPDLRATGSMRLQRASARGKLPAAVAGPPAGLRNTSVVVAPAAIMEAQLMHQLESAGAPNVTQLVVCVCAGTRNVSAHGAEEPSLVAPSHAPCFAELVGALSSWRMPQLLQQLDAFMAEGPTRLHLTVYLDALGHVGSDDAQMLLINEVLLTHDFFEDMDLVKHALLALTHSIMQGHCCSDSLLNTLDQLAFPTSAPTEPGAEELQHRAALVLGIAANALARQDPARAALWSARLHAALGMHDADDAQRRSALRAEAEHRLAQTHPSSPEYDRLAGDLHSHIQHEQRQMVLLEALGNAAHSASLPHVISHANSSHAPAPVRRAAISALGQFSCQDSHDALLQSAVADHDPLVRQVRMTSTRRRRRR